MKPVKFRFEYEMLYQLYMVEDHSDKEIAAMVDCPVGTVRGARKKFGLKRADKFLALDEAVIRQLYVVERKTDDEIAEVLKCTSEDVRRYRRKYNIATVDRRFNYIKKELLLEGVI